MTRDAEWDDDERAWAEGFAEFEAGIHHGCGVHRDRMRPGVDHYAIKDDVCPMCAQVDRWRRVQAKRDEEARDHAKSQAGGELPPEAPDPADGRSTLLLPSTEEESRRRAEAAAEAAKPKRAGREKPAWVSDVRARGE